MKEQVRSSEKQLSELEISNRHEKDFRVKMVNMIQDHGGKKKKLEAKIDKLQETLNKEIDLKIKQADMQIQ